METAPNHNLRKFQYWSAGGDSNKILEAKRKIVLNYKLILGPETALRFLCNVRSWGQQGIYFKFIHPKWPLNWSTLGKFKDSNLRPSDKESQWIWVLLEPSNCERKENNSKKFPEKIATSYRESGRSHRSVPKKIIIFAIKLPLLPTRMTRSTENLI